MSGYQVSLLVSDASVQIWLHSYTYMAPFLSGSMGAVRTRAIRFSFWRSV